MKFMKSFLGLSLMEYKGTYICWDNYLGKPILIGNFNECNKYFNEHVKALKRK